MSTSTSLTERQRFWLEHIRACGNGSLKAYATAHQLDIRSLYEAKSRLKRPPTLDSGDRNEELSCKRLVNPVVLMLA